MYWSVDGLLPTGEFLSAGEGVSAPELVVSSVLGGVVLLAKGAPRVTVSPDTEIVHVALLVEDVSSIGLGRFTYSLVVFNDVGGRRVVLAGMLTVVESQPPVPNG